MIVFRAVGQRPQRGNQHDSIKSAVPYFDRTAQNWARVYDLSTAGGHALRERARRLFELLDDRSGDALDVGCGTAAIAAELTARGWRVTGVDAAPSMMTEARQRLWGVSGSRAIVADARMLPFAERAFDAVICLGVLDRVDAQRLAVSELVRVAHRKARIVISFPNRLSPYATWTGSVFRPAVGRLKSLAVRARGGVRVPDLASRAILHSPRSATELVESAGARVDAVVHFNYNVLLPPLDEWFPRAAARLVEHLEPAHEGRLAWIGSGFLVAAHRV